MRESYDIKRGLDEVLREIYESAKRLLEESSKKILIVHHDDADGIAAAALLKVALEDRFTVQAVCLEKTYPQAVKKLQAQGKEPIIYVDLGSPHVSMITSLNPQRRRIIVIDHHDLEFTGKVSEEVTILNPEVHGVDGGTYACGASLAYFFTRSIKENVEKHANLAVIGSVEIPGEIRGFNLLALNDAVRAGVAIYDEKNKKAKVLWDGKFTNPETLSTKLTIMASVGYYEGGPQKALSACVKCSWSGLEDLLDELEERRKRAYLNVLARLRYVGLNKLKWTQWFHVEDEFRDMGVKVIGTFCSYLMHQRIVDDNKVLVGIMNMKSYVPELGDLEGNYVKVSARAPKKILTLIETGSLRPLSKALAEAAKQVGGFGDGHLGAASGIIPKGREREFVEIMDKLLEKDVKGSEKDKAKTTLEKFLFPKKVE
ncbi:MAG: DHH family phosphoesterase [Candidatus Nezhaarchaeales archaeon]